MAAGGPFQPDFCMICLLGQEGGAGCGEPERLGLSSVPCLCIFPSGGHGAVATGSLDTLKGSGCWLEVSAQGLPSLLAFTCIPVPGLSAFVPQNQVLYN